MQFDQVTANVGEAQLQFNGMIGGGTPSVFQDFVIRAKGSATNFDRCSRPAPFPTTCCTAWSPPKVQLSGPSGAPHLRGEIGLNEAKLVLPTLGEKPFGSPASLELDADVTKGTSLVISRLELVVPPLRLPLKGRIILGDQFSIDASLATGTVSVSSLPEWVYRSGFEAGRLEVSMDVKGRMPSGKLADEWVARAHQRPDDAERRGRRGRRHLPSLEVFQEHRRHQTVVVPDQGQRCEPLRALKNWTTKPVIAVKIESAQMDLDLLIPKGTVRRSGNFWRRWPRPAR